MNEFASQPGSFERDPIVISKQMLALFEAIDSYNNDRSTFLHSISTLSLDTLAQEQIDYELLRRLDDIEEEADEGHALGREMLQLLHGKTLQSSGLTFDESLDYLTIHIIDGATLARALTALTVEPEARQRLRNHLEAYFDDWLKLICGTVIANNPERTLTLMGTTPTNWVITNADERANDLRTVDQLLRHGLTLAASLETRQLAGRADDLRKVVAFASDSDLLPWAIASRYGLMPETAPEKDPSLGIWAHWREYNDWAPIFRLLRAANPVGAFVAYLKHCALTGIDGHITVCRRKLDEDFAQYVDSCRRTEEWLGITSNIEIPYDDYIGQQNNVRLLIEQLTLVRHELQDFPD